MAIPSGNGKTDMMSYWTFRCLRRTSDVFEERGVIKTPFYGGYGSTAMRGIPKPAFNAFALLHELGDERIAEAEDDVLVTRRNDARWRSPYGIWLSLRRRVRTRLSP
jgi:xylan 1,4-beta-xylosidase